MVRRINDQCLEDFDKPVTKIYMKRNRVANLNLMHDSPFAIDRQLEDQKFLMNFNKVFSLSHLIMLYNLICHAS